MRFFITGGGGFIGSNLADRQLAAGHTVTVYDNFSTGQPQFLDQARQYPNFQLIEGDMLEAMRANGVRRIGFSSTGSIYGEPDVFPTPETCPFPVQTSLYGASKLAGEGLIAAYCAGFGFQAYIFRFVSILGERYTHGHVFDFYKKLLANPHQIEVLGNGKQRKSYLYVQDCIDAMLTVIGRADEQVNVYNLGADEYCQVDDSLGWICAHLGLNPKRHYS